MCLLMNAESRSDSESVTRRMIIDDLTDPRIDEVEVSASDPIDWATVAAYLREKLPADALPDGDRSREMDVVRFTGGHSNLTYGVRFGASELVLRRPPAGPVAPTAHDMAREFR